MLAAALDAQPGPELSIALSFVHPYELHEAATRLERFELTLVYEFEGTILVVVLEFGVLGYHPSFRVGTLHGLGAVARVRGGGIYLGEAAHEEYRAVALGVGPRASAQVERRVGLPIDDLGQGRSVVRRSGAER